MESTLVRSLLFSLLIALLLIGLGPTPVTHAATVNLNVDRFDDPAVTVASTGAAACTAAANDCSLRGAILTANAAASSNYIINLPSGTYTLTQAGASEDLDRTGDLDITRDVAILGAGASATVINGNNLDRVFDIRAGNVTISGVTIKGGKAPDGPAAIPDMIPLPGGPGQDGGGIMNTAALTVTNSIITANHTGAGGAGAASTLVFFPPSSGGTGGAGGGIYNSGALTVISTTISSNGTGNGGAGPSGTSGGSLGASGGNGGDGGGIFNSGTLTFTATIVQSNHAGSGGNGGAGSDGSLTFFIGGTGGIGGNGGNGGGIYNLGSLSLARTVLAANLTGNGGQGGAGGAGGASTIPAMPGYAGGIGGAGGKGGNGSAIHNSGLATATNSTLSGNTAGNGGAGANGGTGGAGLIAPPSAGGIGGNGGNAGNGGNGGIYNYNSLFTTAAITMSSATMAANTTGNSGSPGSGGSGGTGGPGMPSGNNGSPGANGTVGTGGGIAVFGGTFNLKNTILANNTAPAGGLGPDCYGSITSQGYNFIRSLTGCTVGGSSTGNITGQDPKLNALADNGGGTLTHALQSTSPARNAGDPAGCKDAAGNLLLVDQRGLPRTYGGRCDIGAFELQSSDLFLPLLRR